VQSPLWRSTGHLVAGVFKQIPKGFQGVFGVVDEQHAQADKAARVRAVRRIRGEVAALVQRKQHAKRFASALAAGFNLNLPTV